jgi:acyl carrier protein
VRRTHRQEKPMGKLTIEELLERVRPAFKSAFDVDPEAVTIDTAPSDISTWNSMGHVTLITYLEEVFELTFSIDEFMAMENVREICKVVQFRLGQGQEG